VGYSKYNSIDLTPGRLQFHPPPIQASLEEAAKLAGVTLSKMMDILAGYGVEATLAHEDYLQSLKTASKIW